MNLIQKNMDSIFENRVHRRFKIGLLFLLLIFQLESIGQEKISVTYGYNENTETYQFVITNNTNYFQVVILDGNFKSLIPSLPIPAVINLSPKATNRALTLKRAGIGTPSISYTYRYITGCTKIEPENVIYALPLAHGKETFVSKMVDIGSYVRSNDSPENFNAVAFKMNIGDTIFASRRGVVMEVKEDEQLNSENAIYNKRINFIKVQHKDCTIAKYSNFDREQIFVKEGDFIEVGTALGKVSSGLVNNDIQCWQQSYYYRVEEVINNIQAKTVPNYFPIVYQIDENATGKLNHNQVYRASINDELIMQEMSKREIKKRNIDRDN